MHPGQLWSVVLREWQMVAAITAKKLWDFSSYVKTPEEAVRQSCNKHNLPFNAEPHDPI